MINFRQLLNEAKQVGTIYHFTKLKNINDILSSGQLKSSALTGMLNKSVDDEGKNNISMSRNYGGTGDIVREFGTVRIAFDGNKISNKYKIKPFIDSQNFITRDLGEWEEQVRAKSLSIKDYVIRIDILQDDRFDYGIAMKLAELWRKGNFKFNINVVSKFLPVKYQDKAVVNTFSK